MHHLLLAGLRGYPGSAPHRPQRRYRHPKGSKKHYVPRSKRRRKWESMKKWGSSKARNMWSQIDEAVTNLGESSSHLEKRHQLRRAMRNAANSRQLDYPRKKKSRLKTMWACVAVAMQAKNKI